MHQGIDMSDLKPKPRGKGGRKPKGARFVTKAFSLPVEIASAVEQAAAKRFDESQSAVATEALAEWFGISADGGESPEKQQIPA
jgi:hypothetical protein